MSVSMAMQSTFRTGEIIPEESYCAPWDLKIQEEKFQRAATSSNTRLGSIPFSQAPAHNPSPPIPAVRRASTKKSPPSRPPLPPGGLLPAASLPPSIIRGLAAPHRTVDNYLMMEHVGSSRKKMPCSVNSPINQSDAKMLHSFICGSLPSSQCRGTNQTLTREIDLSTNADDSEPMSFQAALLCFQQLTDDIELPTAYEQPWDAVQASLLHRLSSTNNRNSESLRKISTTEETKQHSSLARSLVASSRHRTSSLEEKTMKKHITIPIDRYFWYHYTMSRRQAETILKPRSPGSFLVRQSESGNQKDYSLSIRTARNCVHMRICYSAGVYILGECSRPFSSVSQIIEYFSQTSVPICGAEHIKLSTPVLRCELLSSLLYYQDTHAGPGNDDLL